jgi:hypothetical protein
MYKAYLDAELSLPKSTKDSYLSAAGYYSDDVGDQDAAVNSGFLKRAALFATSRTAQFISKIDVDLFNQPNYMISGVEIEIEITPNESAFTILEPANTARTRKNPKTQQEPAKLEPANPQTHVRSFKPALIRQIFGANEWAGIGNQPKT